MSINVKMNDTTHELLEAKDNTMTVLGSTRNTVWTALKYPDNHVFSDYESFVLDCAQWNGYSGRTLATTSIPVTDDSPILNASTSDIVALYAPESNIYEANVYFSESQFYLKSYNSNYCLARLFGKLKSGGVILRELLKRLRGGFGYVC